jgi:hypothetical protein
MNSAVAGELADSSENMVSAYFQVGSMWQLYICMMKTYTLEELDATNFANSHDYQVHASSLNQSVQLAFKGGHSENLTV